MVANLSNSSNQTDCSPYIIPSYALEWTVLAISVVILFGLSFVHQRTNLCKDVCWSLPGIVQPFNLLTHSANHTINVIIFAALSGDILLALEQNRLISDNIANHYAALIFHTVILPLVTVLQVCMKYFPLFACVDTPIPLVGHITGLIYLPFLVTAIIVRDLSSACGLDHLQLDPQHKTHVLTGLYIGARLPIYLAFLGIIVWYVYSVIRDCILWYQLGFQTAISSLRSEHRSYNYYKKCVEHLLKRREGEENKLVSCLCPYLTSPRKLPLRFTGALVMAILILYQICLLLSGALFYGISLLDRILFENKKQIVQTFGETTTTIFIEITHSLLVVLPVSPIVSMAFCLLLVAHMSLSVYKNIQKAARGQLELKKEFSSFRLAASLRFAGYQIAFILTAFLFYTLVLWVFGLCGCVVYFGFKYFTDTALYGMTLIIVSIGWIGIVLGIQVGACKALFLKRGGGRFIIISNKKLFQWFIYVLFVYNSIVGLLSALLRVIISSILGLILMLRLDRVILMKGFEALDIGHNTYSGFLHVDHTYNNPVIHVFVRLMADVPIERAATGRKRLKFGGAADKDLAHGVQDTIEISVLTNIMLPQTEYGGTETIDSDTGPVRNSRRIKNRWLVAYTLIKNPSIRGLTGSQLMVEGAQKVTVQ